MKLLHPETVSSPLSISEVIVNNDNTTTTIRPLLQTAAKLVVVLLLAVPMLLSAFQGVEATAYTINVYAPDPKANNQMQAWANLSRDCSGTVGCYNYMKIERKVWWGNEFVTGKWANTHGWNNLWATKVKGCHYYRTTIDSYNRIVGDRGIGSNIGVVGVSGNGLKVYEDRVTWSSGWTYMCT